MVLRLQKRRKLAAALVAAVVAASAALALAVADSASPPESGPAVKSHVGHSYIFSVDVATGQMAQETNHQGEGALEPTWSTQGDIAFSTMPCDECTSELAEVDPAAPIGPEAKIETSAQHLFQPSWAPDGKRLATVGLGRGIYSVDTTDGSAQRLTTGPSDEAPDWSPGGHLIAFHRQIRGSNYDLFAVNPATGKERRLTEDSKQQTNPTWNTDGSQIAFAEQQPTGRWAIVVMNTGGTGRRVVTDPSISAQEPAWSPDGKRIAFILQELDKAALAVIDTSGGTPKRLTDDKVFPAKPTWSPDGKRIAFSATLVQEPPPS
jgi:Tol biopolymer transport system component